MCFHTIKAGTNTHSLTGPVTFTVYPGYDLLSVRDVCLDIFCSGSRKLVCVCVCVGVCVCVCVCVGEDIFVRFFVIGVRCNPGQSCSRKTKKTNDRLNDSLCISNF